MNSSWRPVKTRQKSAFWWQLIVLALTASVGLPQPVLAQNSQTFEALCRARESLAIQTEYTVELLLAIAETEDCSRAMQVLSDRQQLTIQDPYIADLSPLATLPQLQSLELRLSNPDPPASNTASPTSRVLPHPSFPSTTSAVASRRPPGSVRLLPLDFEPLEALPNWVQLHIESIQLQDLRTLTFLKNLEELKLIYRRANRNDGTRALTGKELQTDSNNLVQDLSPLVALNRLTTLHIEGATIEDVTPLASLVNLQHLTLDAFAIADISSLASLVNLQTLALDNANRVEDISALAPLVNLQHLTLERSQVTDLSPLASLTALTSLNLANVPAITYEPLKSLPQLTELDLSGSSIRDLDLLQSFSDLAVLDVGGTLVEDLDPLTSLSQLRVLGIGGLAIDDFSALQDLTQLEEVIIGTDERENPVLLATIPNTAQIYYRYYRRQIQPVGAATPSRAVVSPQIPPPPPLVNVSPSAANVPPLPSVPPLQSVPVTPQSVPVAPPPLWSSSTADALQDEGFETLCEQKAALPPSTRHTVEVLLAIIGTRQCSRAAVGLMNVEQLAIGEPDLADLAPLATLPQLQALELRLPRSQSPSLSLEPLSAHPTKTYMK